MPQSPFKLLEPYGPDEKDIFFGRDAEIFALYHLLQQTRILLIYGGSGTGKTSLINAGLPKVFKVTDWFRISVRRKDNLNASLCSELARLTPEAAPGSSLVESIQAVYESRWIPIYLVFDQFEELFTLGNHEERAQFFKDIQSILAANLPCKIILSMREEYIGHLYDYEQYVPALFEKRFRLEPMKDATVTDVVEKMCAINGIELEREEKVGDSEKSTAERILEQVKTGKQAAYLPYLQIYLHYLYEHATAGNRRPVFREANIEAVGELGDVLKKFIDSKTADAQQFLLPFGATDDFAQRLLDEFSTGEGTKQSRKKGELATSLSAGTPSEKVSPDLVDKALHYFSDTAKLLRADENEVERYEPVHDVVAKQIHELRTAEDKEFKAFVRQLELAHERWEKDHQSTDRLLPELDLSKVDIYLARMEQREDFKTKWSGLVSRSREHHEALRQRKRLRNIALLVITALAIVASIVALIFNFRAQADRDKAVAAQAQAEASRKEAEMERDNARTVLARFHKAEAEKVMKEVNDILKRAEQLRARYPGMAKNLLDDVRKMLEGFTENPILQEELRKMNQ